MREIINSFIYDNKDKIVKALRRIFNYIFVLAFFSFFIYHGFELKPETSQIIFLIFKAFYALFIINYLLKLFFTLNRKKFIKDNSIETILCFMLVVNTLTFYVLSVPIIESFLNLFGAHIREDYYELIIQLILLIYIGIDVLKGFGEFTQKKYKPSIMLAVSFLLIIIIGSILLSFPQMNQASPLPYLDSLFMSTSATCVTGLATTDVSSQYTLKGHLILMALIQIGGIGILSFAFFFAMFIRQGVGVNYQNVLRDIVDSENIQSTYSIIRRIVSLTFIIESIVAIGLYFSWPSNMFENQGLKIFYSIFHAISAFCNAGITLFSNGLYEDFLKNNNMLQLAIIFGIICGGLGFSNLTNLTSISFYKSKLKHPWKKLPLDTKISLYTSLFLILLGTIVFGLLEYKNTLKEMSINDSIMASLFQSVTSRTAGFNTIDIGSLAPASLVFIMFLMFIGASSGSTGGGIKVGTFVIIFLAIGAIVKGKKNFTIGRRNIPKSLIFKAFSVFVFSITYIFITTFILILIEKEMDPMAIAFESVSAYCTVGLSTGITPQFTDISKALLSLSMFIGRIGILTLAFSLSSTRTDKYYRYPDSHLMIG